MLLGKPISGIYLCARDGQPRGRHVTGKQENSRVINFRRFIVLQANSNTIHQ
jgi:hypothetical protein